MELWSRLVVLPAYGAFALVLYEQEEAVDAFLHAGSTLLQQLYISLCERCAKHMTAHPSMRG